MPCWSKHCGAKDWKQKKQHPWDIYYWIHTSCKQYLLAFFTPKKSINVHLISEDYNTLVCILRHYNSNRSIPASWHTQSHHFTGERLSTQYCMSDYQSTSRSSTHLLKVAGRFSKQTTEGLSNSISQFSSYTQPPSIRAASKPSHKNCQSQISPS